MAAPLKVDITNDRGTGELTYVFETDRAFPVPENEGKSHLVRNRCRYVLPRDWRREDTHPDLLALAGITAIAPYAPEEIEFSMPVSSCFHQSCLDFLGKRVGPVDHTLKRREPPPYSIIGLSYSGGVDSTAALQLLPEETVSFFLNRMNESARRTLYSGEAALQACDELRENGRVVYIVDSDMEHLRNPVGFPVDIACANPAILMADRECLDAVAFGTILESAYRIGYGGFQDYARRDHFLKWGGLFRTVGLPFCQVTAGSARWGPRSLFSGLLSTMWPGPAKGARETVRVSTVSNASVKCLSTGPSGGRSCRIHGSTRLLPSVKPGTPWSRFPSNRSALSPTSPVATRENTDS